MLRSMTRALNVLVVCAFGVALIAAVNALRVGWLNIYGGYAASTLECLGGQPQLLLWKDENTAVFRSPDGIKRYVVVGNAAAKLKVGAIYRVEQPCTVKEVGCQSTPWLKQY